MTLHADPVIERAALSLLRELADSTPDRRDELLRERSADNPALAARVRQLLARLVDDDARIADDSDDVSGSTIGPYIVLRRIGRGGMGEVFLAERADGAFRRRVALKRIWGGLLPLAERFRRERDILARLSHPNIARLYDGGVTEQGQPWFAMEYIEGDAITRWCDAHQASVEQRVDLLATVCEAVQFAHSNLIVHRDLKPANVLVGTDGRPRLLDFGIAKLLDEADPQATQTLAMTPAWAAPEQRNGGAITTATDVWQLGTLLRALLAGDTGSEADSRLGSSFTHLIREFPQKARDTATARDTTPERLLATLRGDLERIVAVATATEPSERYPTPQTLLDDLQRWRNHRPVRAHTASWPYRARKFLRRHRTASVLVATLAAATVAAGLFGWQRLQAEREQFRRAEATVQFMRDVFAANKPEQRKGEQYSAEELLDVAVATLPEQFKDDLLTRATLEGEVGNVYMTMGLMGKARPHLEYAVSHLAAERERNPTRYLELVEYLADVCIEVNDPKAALAVLSANMDFARSVPQDSNDPPHAGLLLTSGEALALLGRKEEAFAQYREALQVLMADSNGPTKYKARAHTNVAISLVQAGRVREALPLYRQALLLHQTPESMEADRLVARYNLARAYARLGETDEAIARYEGLLAPLRREAGIDHPRVTTLYMQLAMSYGVKGDYRKGAETAAALRGELGKDSDPVNRAMLASYEAELLTSALRPDLALPLLREASDLLEPGGAADVGGEPTDPRANARAALGEALLQAGDVAGAERAFQSAYDDGEVLANGRPEDLPYAPMDGLARTRLMQGDYDGAITWLQRASGLLAKREPLLHHEDVRRVRSDVHLQWARALKNRDARDVQALAALRPRLAAALQASEHPMLWQFDLLHARLARELNTSGPPPARLQASRQRLEAAFGKQIQANTGLVFAR